MAIIRHYFPGNNTPQGFFSYYEHILDQREAERIICIKGGPGTGKSTFMKKIGERLESAGTDIDYLHCSADESSIDGILLPEKKIAMIDGTSPHMIDPVTPGAVDTIINFGDFWNDKKIAEVKDEIITCNEACSKWYQIAYQYLSGAKAMLDGLSMLQKDGIQMSELYKLASDVINREYARHDIAVKAGRVKKFFATGITPAGLQNYVGTLLGMIDTVYLIHVPEGYDNTTFMNVLMDGAVYRGFLVEAYYCPMDPVRKIEHLIIPELSLAFVTTNQWHDMEPWEVAGEEGETGKEKEIILVDISDYQSLRFKERNKSILNKMSEHYKMMIEQGIYGLSRAKENHDVVEKMYIRNMDFEKIDALAEDTVKELLQ